MLISDNAKEKYRKRVKLMKPETGRKSTAKWLNKLLAYVLVLFMLSLISACVGTGTGSTLSTSAPGAQKALAKNMISAYELHKILTDHFGYVSIKLSDVHYALLDNSKIAQLERSGHCGSMNAKEIDGWGCDDYAIAAMVPMRNYAFGTVFGSGAGGAKQVVNVLVNVNKEVVYWEPQACRYYHGQFDKPDFILF